MIIRLEDVTGQLRTAKVGFSWTVLFFGFCVPIYRGDAKWAVIMFIANVFTLWLANLILSFTYNETYIRDLLTKGYRPADEEARKVLISKGIISG
ncbi:MAG: hypothetical protein GXZ00_06700 [Synergistaceae bacterium]|nr:hypothetical protein [Synergistaceae bacterium]